MFTAQDETYYQRVVGMIEYTKKLDPQAPACAIRDEHLTERCPECGQVPMGSDLDYHRMHDDNVIVACEGYYVVDPNLVGFDSPNWMDWKDNIEDVDFWKETGINDNNPLD